MQLRAGHLCALLLAALMLGAVPASARAATDHVTSSTDSATPQSGELRYVSRTQPQATPSSSTRESSHR